MLIIQLIYSTYILACEEPNLLCTGKDTKYKICVSKELQCDGIWHCNEGEDEDRTKTGDPKCPEKEVECKEGQFTWFENLWSLTKWYIYIYIYINQII